LAFCGSRAVYTIDSAESSFLDRENEFTDVAQQYENFGGSFCSNGNDSYLVNGDFFNFKAHRFFVGGGPLGEDREVTYEELLQNVFLANEKFTYYKKFLEDFPFIECMLGVTTGKFTGTEFLLPFNGDPSRDGFLYVSKGSPVLAEYQGLRQLNRDWYVVKTKAP